MEPPQHRQMNRLGFTRRATADRAWCLGAFLQRTTSSSPSISQTTPTTWRTTPPPPPPPELDYAMRWSLSTGSRVHVCEDPARGRAAPRWFPPLPVRLLRVAGHNPVRAPRNWLRHPWPYRVPAHLPPFATSFLTCRS